MADLIYHTNTLGEDNPILKRTGRGLGITRLGAEGTLGSEGYKILLYVCIPQRVAIPVIFPNNKRNEVIQ